MNKEYAITMRIFKHEGGDCSNYGISHRYNEILLLSDEGYIEVDMENPPENLCILVKRELWGENHDYIKPYALRDKWTMFGGCFVYSGDSRCPNRALKLHDRVEN